MSTDILKSELVKDLISLAIKEDLPAGDITSELTIDKQTKGHAIIEAREEFIFCGGPLVKEIFNNFGFTPEINVCVAEGGKVKAKQALVKISGLAHEILIAERTILNFLQRLSGVASKAHDFSKISNTLKVLDTRKTMPGWRSLDKYACRAGGAKNHRMSLSDMILIKDNHIFANDKSVSKTLRKVVDNKPEGIRVEVEVETISDLKEALSFPIDVVMLDNFSNEEIKEALAVIKDKKSKVEVEVSGGVTIDRIKTLSDLGVSYVSVGGLTTRAINKDIALELELL